jgi:DsbC/DsbD-like thiol-disulfide interchange protein
MATIITNEHAPKEEATYILPTATFDLAQGGSYETDDRRVLSDAEAHPWLEVEYAAEETEVFERPSKSVPYEDDYLSAANSKAFDLDEVRRTEEAKYGGDTNRLAVDAGLDQNEEVVSESGAFAYTLAGDDRDEATRTAEPADEDDNLRED